MTSDVFACLSGDCLVFLDLRRDEYSCLDRATTAEVLNVLDDLGGTAREGRSTNEHPVTERAKSAVQALTIRGLLSPARGSQRKSEPVYVEVTRTILDPQAEYRSPAKHARHRLAFLRATLAASAKLRCYPLFRTVRSIGRHKQESTLAPRSCDRLAELVSIFHRLRPLYPRPYLCLYDSLALLEFLSHFGLCPQWVFGVRTEPFNAHCWIQHSDCVLNDTVEEVRDYTPIMIV